MRHVYLPTEHSATDLVLAGLIAELLESSTLYVTWSPSGYRQARIETIVRPASAPLPAPTAIRRPGRLTDIVGMMAAFVGALFAPRRAARRGDAPAAPA